MNQYQTKDSININTYDSEASALNIESATSKSTISDSLSIQANKDSVILIDYNSRPAMKMIKENTINDTWLIAVLLISLFIISTLRFSFNKLLSKIFSAAFNIQIASKLHSEKNARNQKGSLIIDTLFFINISILLSELILFYYPNNLKISGFKIFIICLFSSIIVYAVKISSTFLFGNIFNFKTPTIEYLKNLLNYNKIYGLILFPIIAIIPFINIYAVNILLKITLLIGLLCFILRIFRGIRILFKKHVSSFYMILYLCALEILPLLILVKLFTIWILGGEQ